MGVMYWHLNDLWISPTGSSIDYNLVWKMSHYFAKKSYAKTILIPYIENKTHLKLSYSSDSQDTVSYNATIRFLPYDSESFTPSSTKTIEFTAKPLSSDEIFSLSLEEIKKNSKCELDTENSCLVTFELVSSDGAIESDNFLFMNRNISQVKNLKTSNLSISNVRKLDDVKSDEVNFEIELTSNYVSLFVWLELNANSTSLGRFSDNGFHLTRANKKIFFTTSDKELSVESLKKYLSIKSLINVYDKLPVRNAPSRSARLNCFGVDYLFLVVLMFSNFVYF